MKRLWRWLTYKRVLIVYNANHISRHELAKVIYALEAKWVDAIALCSDESFGDTIRVFRIDDLFPAQFEWIKARMDALEYDPALRAQMQTEPVSPQARAGVPQSGVDMAVEAFRTGKYRVPTPDEQDAENEPDAGIRNAGKELL